MDPQTTYESAYKELQQIAREIEQETVSVDVLAAKVARASELISFCQNKLRSSPFNTTMTTLTCFPMW